MKDRSNNLLIKLKKINKKGITLIALVVTIVVLLILAGISVTILFGDNGIVAKAQKAKDETARATAEDRMRLATIDAQSERVIKREYDTRKIF